MERRLARSCAERRKELKKDLTSLKYARPCFQVSSGKMKRKGERKEATIQIKDTGLIAWTKGKVEIKKDVLAQARKMRA